MAAPVASSSKVTLDVPALIDRPKSPSPVATRPLDATPVANRPINARVEPLGRSGDSSASRPIVRPSTGNSIVVNLCQKGNPIMNHMRAGWEFGDIVPDYQVGGTSCVLYLSLRYHRLHPEYIHGRISKLGQMYNLRILLVMCDVEDNQEVLKELTKVAIINNLTMMVAWSNEEAGRYLETYKLFERKPPDLIKERVEKDYMSQVTAVLTSVKGVNKTDVVTLLTTFGSLKGIVDATPEQLTACPGLGEKKVKRLRDTFSHPFVVQSPKDPASSQAAKRARLGPELN